jgi:dTDP-4-dehydrorhamnose 3,5-epimerase
VVKITLTALPGVLVLEPRVFRDERGSFRETWLAERYLAVTPLPFAQDNVSASRRGVVRGLHFQQPNAQGKLVSVLAGSAYDVAVDVRRGSPTFGRWVAEELSQENGRQLWIPGGFAHGFQALADDTILLYKCTDVYHPECERTALWSDPALAIPWPLAGAIVARKDAAAPPLGRIPAEHLPSFE